MLSSAILASSVLAQAALGVRIFATADIGTENTAVADLAVEGSAALAQIDAVAASNAEQKEYNEQKQIDKLLAKAAKPSKKPNVGIDLEEMGGGFEDRFREGYRQRESQITDLDGNIIGRSGSGSASGSWSAAGSGSYENSRGSGSWEFSASMSFSVSFEHNWSPHSKSPVNPEDPAVSPSPIPVNPCECCDCGDGAYKVPVLFQKKNKGDVSIMPVDEPIYNKAAPTTAAQTDSCATVTCDCQALVDVCSA